MLWLLGLIGLIPPGVLQAGEGKEGGYVSMKYIKIGDGSVYKGGKQRRVGGFAVLLDEFT